VLRFVTRPSTVERLDGFGISIKAVLNKSISPISEDVIWSNEVNVVEMVESEEVPYWIKDALKLFKLELIVERSSLRPI
jgi:hypothetical protein